MCAIIRALTVCFVLLTSPAVAVGAEKAGALSPAEQIYKDLATLSPPERQRRIEEGARLEGKLSIIHTMRGAESANHLALFRKRYPFIEIDATSNIGSQEAAERLLAEETAGRHLTDIVVTAVIDLSELLRRDMLARYPTPATDAILPRYRGFIDPQNRWVSWFWSEHGISYNPKMVTPDHAPKSWMDLCDPYFRGNVSFDPAEARFLSGLYSIFGEQQAQAYLKCLGANDPIIQRGHSQRIELMMAGDHMAQGDNYLYHGLEIQRASPQAPYAMVLSAPIMANNDDLTINRNAPHPYAAALFADWSLSQESQAYVAGLLRGPVAYKHPFLDENVRLVDNVEPSREIMDRLFGYWRVYMEKKR
jgi:iron(III) transport system substrate-binding protein